MVRRADSVLRIGRGIERTELKDTNRPTSGHRSKYWAMSSQLLSNIAGIVGDKGMLNQIPIDCASPQTKKVP
jgi:hypothetical protein